MSLVSGRHLDDFLAQRPSQKLRDEVGSHLFELFYFQLLLMETFHADPHWGNYLFNDDGSIGLVDFGCVKHVQPESVSYLRSVSLYPGARDSAAFRRILESHYRPAGKALLSTTRRALVAFADNFYHNVYPPEHERQQEAFDFGDVAFLQNYLRQSRNLFRTKGVLPEFIFMGRAEMGLYQTLHRLRARVFTSKIVRKFLRPA